MIDKQLSSRRILRIILLLALSSCGQPESIPIISSEKAVQPNSTTLPTESTKSTAPPEETKDLSTTITHTIIPPAAISATSTEPSTAVSVTSTEPSAAVSADKDHVNAPKSEWRLDSESDAVGPDGVSPEAILLEDGRVRLYVTSMGIEVWESADGLTFEKVPSNTPAGADPTLVRTADGWRMYFTEIPPGGPGSGRGKIRTAISKDGIDWVIESDTGIIQENDRRAWGVPDSFVLSDGQVRIMWTDMVPGKRREVLRSATSLDGVSFTPDDGVRLSGGFVDSYVLTGAPEFMLVSTSPPGGPVIDKQRIFIATSKDGMNWSSGESPLLDRSPRNALDPTAIFLEEGRWRVYYTLTEGPEPFSGFRIASAILTGPASYNPEPTLLAPAVSKLESTDTTMQDPSCEDSRYTFTDLGIVLTAQDAGNSNPMAPMANPSSLLLSDGNIRLFFTNAGAGIGSAISSDGISFEYEGIRISGPEAMSQGVNLGPLRVYRLPDNRIRLFVGSSQTGVQSFVSEDEGQTFSVEPGERISQSAADMKAIQKLSIIPIGENLWQGYFGPAPQHGEPKKDMLQGGPPNHWLRRATSSNLFDWNVEPGIIIGPGAPHLTASAREVYPLLRDDGCVTLFYQLNKPQDAGIRDFTGVAVMGYSTSEDGIMFKKQHVLINVRDPAGPDILHLPDATMLMYHDSTDHNGYGHGIRVGRLEINNP